MKAPREIAAVRDLHRVRAALRALLGDTQHFWHECTDDDCPVRIARRALNETDIWGERPCTIQKPARSKRLKGGHSE